jgi:MYXO-CTERM domain-containing protein
VGDTVTLNGGGSNDVDGDGLSFAWSLTRVPAGSAATLSRATAVKPTFVVDVSGTYTAQLTVNDGKVSSAPDSVSISTDNSAPVADAGADQSALVGDTVTLNGGGSNDVDGDGLTFAWSLSSIPAGSTATLSNATVFNPAFLMDLPGTYVAQLIVNDGKVSSVPDTVSVTSGKANPVVKNAAGSGGGGGSSGGGGCSVRTGAAPDPTLHLLMLLSLLGYLYRRRSSQRLGYVK